MPISGIDGGQPAEQSSPLGASQGTLDKEAFLKLLVAQLSNQDPLSPMQGTEFVTQLAQFSSVEQQITQSSKLDLISLQLRGLASNEATALVGKTVTVAGDNTVSWDGTNLTGNKVSLVKAESDVTVNVRDAEGNIVSTKEYDNLAAGPLPDTFWDGQANGNPAKNGTYTVEVVGKDGKPLEIESRVTSVVNQVSFEKGYPELILANGMKVAVSELISVGVGPGGGTYTIPGGSGAAGGGVGLAPPMATSPALTADMLKQLQDLLAQ
jgi:flagellar basal-body rod modification protein FlgD